MSDTPQTFLTEHLLVAMPSMGDPRFERTVIFLCSHDEEGAMGLVVNAPVAGVDFADLAEQLSLPGQPPVRNVPVRGGGPVEKSRGFLLHSGEYAAEQATLSISPAFGMTATIEALKALSEGDGPRDALLALGYSGWGPGQLEGELQQNAWLTVPATPELVFHTPAEAQWDKALAAIGIDPRLLAATGGSA